MNTTELIAQAIGIVAMSFQIISFQCKERKSIILLKSIGSALFAVNFFMLGAVSGFLLNIVGIMRGMVYYFEDKFHAKNIAWVYFFALIYFVSYAATFVVFGKEPSLTNFIVELVPTVASIIITVSYRMPSAKMVRRYGLVSSPMWLFYNIVNFAVGAICCEVISLISILLGMWRLDRNKPAKS